MGGSLAAPTAPQRTDVAPNRCGEPVSRLKGTPTLQGREEVRYLQKIFLSAQIFLVLNGTGFPKLGGLAR